MPQPVWLKLEDDIQQMQLQSINVRSIAAGKTGIDALVLNRRWNEIEARDWIFEGGSRQEAP